MFYRLASRLQSQARKGVAQMLGTILIIFLVLALLGSLPTWGYSTGWGYYPSGGLGLLVLILVVLVLMGRI
jgi:FtsH-binding integral membrane protein